MSITKRLAQCSGLVVGPTGRGGSGTCVQLEDESIALLTAKHVVIECLRNTGRVAIASYGKPFGDPLEIRMDSSQAGDAAYLVFQHARTPEEFVPFSKWTTSRTDLVLGQKVFACGYPGTLRAIEGSTFRSRFFCLADKIIDIQHGRIVSGISELIVGLPTSLGGLSGGGLFSEDGGFIGVLAEERRRVTDTKGELISLTPDEFAELYTPFSFPTNIPAGPYVQEQQTLSMQLQQPDGSGVLATVGALAECVWSTSNPDHVNGRIGRLLSLEFVIPGIDTHYPININSTFSWSGDTDDDRQQAIFDEFRFLLLRMGWLVKDEGQGVAVLEIRGMV